MTIQKKIENAIRAGKSIDWIISAYASKRTSSDDVVDIARKIKWDHWKKTGERI